MKVFSSRFRYKFDLLGKIKATSGSLTKVKWINFAPGFRVSVIPILERQMPIQGVRFFEEQAKTANAKLAILLRLPWRHHSPSALTSLSMLPLTLYCLQALIFKKSINEKERKRVLRERKICKKNCTKLCYSICSRDSLCSRKGYHSISIVIIDLDISLPWSIVFFDYSDAVVWEDAFLWYDFLLVSWSEDTSTDITWFRPLIVRRGHPVIANKR